MEDGGEEGDDVGVDVARDAARQDKVDVVVRGARERRPAQGDRRPTSGANLEQISLDALEDELGPSRTPRDRHRLMDAVGEQHGQREGGHAESRGHPHDVAHAVQVRVATVDVLVLLGLVHHEMVHDLHIAQIRVSRHVHIARREAIVVRTPSLLPPSVGPPRRLAHRLQLLLERREVQLCRPLAEAREICPSLQMPLGIPAHEQHGRRQLPTVQAHRCLQSDVGLVPVPILAQLTAHDNARVVHRLQLRTQIDGEALLHLPRVHFRTVVHDLAVLFSLGGQHFRHECRVRGQATNHLLELASLSHADHAQLRHVRVVDVPHLLIEGTQFPQFSLSHRLLLHECLCLLPHSLQLRVAKGDQTSHLPRHLRFPPHGRFHSHRVAVPHHLPERVGQSDSLLESIQRLLCNGRTPSLHIDTPSFPECLIQHRLVPLLFHLFLLTANERIQRGQQFLMKHGMDFLRGHDICHVLCRIGVGRQRDRNLARDLS
ncbi:hypothetical protein PENTCL1PPCAC_34, partial [Pristionchus entomophagus]